MQWLLDIVVDIEIGDEIESLEDESDFLVANARALVIVQTSDILTIERVTAGVELLE